MDEPYHEVAPAESFYELEAEEAPAQTITWFRPEDIQTKVKSALISAAKTSGSTDIAIKAHGKGNVILSTLILRRKVARDPVAQLLLVIYCDTLTSYTHKRAQSQCG